MYSQLQPSNDKKELKYTKFSVFNIQFNDRVEDEGGGVEVKRVREGMMRITLTLKVCFQETLHAKVWMHNLQLYSEKHCLIIKYKKRYQWLEFQELIVFNCEFCTKVTSEAGKHIYNILSETN